MATLIHLPLTAFYEDTATGQIWAPDPNGTVVSPDGIKISPVNPISTGDGTATYAAPTQQQVAAATVPKGTPLPATTALAPPPTPATPTSSSPSSPSSALAQLQQPYGGVPLWGWLAGGVVAVVLMSPKRKR